jgi:SAM-dependent MidA family methyltransferase
LLKYGILDFLPHSAPRDPFSPEAKRTRVIKQLIHPQAMGEVFRVLLQAKGLPIQKNVLENLMKEDET